MEIHLTPEQEAHLYEIAQREGKTAEQLIVDAILNLPYDDLHTRAIIAQRLHEADRGVFIEEEEMDLRFRKMLGR